uniref:Uncharacterized protein n=1 Tax=Anguilla anguilla TaxID=7936 RepID=A0A0E9TNT3_ANGAN
MAWHQPISQTCFLDMYLAGPQTFLKETLRHIFFVWLLLKVPCHLLFYSSIVVLLAFN